jgi:hypothetical protein
MQERRKQPRKDLMSYSQVFDVHGGYLLGYLGDLTELGAMIISDTEVKPNTEITLQIELPELENVSDETITVPARVAWCRQDISPEYYNLGMEFKAITARQREIIHAILENYEFRRQTPNYPLHPNELNQSE